MLKKYKNELFDILKHHELGVDKFTFQDTGEIFKIVFTGAFDRDFEYLILTAGGSYDYFYTSATDFSPGFKVIDRFRDAKTFHYVIENFLNWLALDVLRYLEEQNTPDLWAEYLKNDKVLPLKEADYKKNDNFNQDEKVQVSLAINELKLLINEKFKLTAGHQEIVENRLNYLTESLDRVTNKTDWKGIAMATIVMLTNSLAFDQQQAIDLYNLFVSVMQLLPTIDR